ncbi:GGDEF domain-containing protein [Xanthobacter sp. TB0139]|uniref:GGDEF domain-containing protein n=1 Tax=Xanthobacter sp. TB0139 TaxID=3459178 RepID=UPI0040390DD2
MTDGRLYQFTGPAVAIIMAAAFLLAFLYQTKRRYVLYFALAFLAYALAALVQMLGIPKNYAVNALLSGLIYTACIALMIQGVLLRDGRRGLKPVYYLIAAGIMGLLWVFTYIQPSLMMRIYTQNFGYGLMLLVAAGAIRHRRHSPLIDKVMFWAVLLFGMHFFVRTALTVPITDEITKIGEMYSAGLSREEISANFSYSPFWQTLNFSILICGFALAIVFLLAVVTDIIDDIRRDSATDTLTGLFNRQHFDAEARRLFLGKASRPLSVVFCDLDHFKSINDTFGHAAGDQVLRHFARILRDELRRGDVAARFGGEEFVVLLVGTSLAGAVSYAERVRTHLKQTCFEGLEERSVTGSFGVAQIGEEELLEDAIHRADLMAYEAKRTGRNKVCADEAMSACSVRIGARGDSPAMQSQ